MFIFKNVNMNINIWKQSAFRTCKLEPSTTFYHMNYIFWIWIINIKKMFTKWIFFQIVIWFYLGLAFCSGEFLSPMHWRGPSFTSYITLMSSQICKKRLTTSLVKVAFQPWMTDRPSRTVKRSFTKCSVWLQWALVRLLTFCQLI